MSSLSSAALEGGGTIGRTAAIGGTDAAIGTTDAECEDYIGTMETELEDSEERLVAL